MGLIIFGIILVVIGCGFLVVGQNCETYTIDDLPDFSDDIKDDQVEQYKLDRCSKCKCYSKETDECHCTLHWGAMSGKTIPHCRMNGSHVRNKKEVKEE